MARGLFITLEGGEGAGKSTQAKRLAEHLRHHGHEIVLTREPGGTPGAEALRDVLLFGEAPLSQRAQAFGHMAARAEHLDHAILPALARGATVICDRFHDSTVAYQGYGLGFGEPKILGLIDGLRALIANEPDLTLLLNVPSDVAHARVVQRAGAVDRYEAEDAAFHARVAQGYAALSRQAPDRIANIDASGSLDEVTARIVEVVATRLLAHASR